MKIWKKSKVNKSTFSWNKFPFYNQTHWPECECVHVNSLSCKEASYSITYASSSDPTGELILNIPPLERASPENWNLTVSLHLTTEKITVSSDQASLSLAHGKISIKTLGTLPEAGTVRIKISLVDEETVAKWKFPCVTEIACNIPRPPVTSLLGSIIISCTGLFLVLVLLICVQICAFRAKKNDQLQVGNIWNKIKTNCMILQEAKTRQKVGGRRVVETIPARNQNCRINYMSSNQQKVHQQKDERSSTSESLDLSRTMIWKSVSHR